MTVTERTDKKFLNQSEAGPFLGVHHSTLSRWCKSGEGPPFYQVGAKRMFLVADLEAWLEARKNEHKKE